MLEDGKTSPLVLPHVGERLAFGEFCEESAVEDFQCTCLQKNQGSKDAKSETMIIRRNILKVRKLARKNILTCMF